MKKGIIYLSLGVLAVFGMQCSVKAPEVTVTGEKTALENQVIGTYEKIEQETWLVASVRASGGQRSRKISPEQQRVLDAVQNRKFNKDEINEFKREGVIGENLQGFLEERPHPKMTADAEFRNRVIELLKEENHDREVIMNRVFELNDEAARSSKKEVYMIFAKMHRENTDTDCWIQLPSGDWVKKQ